MMGNHEHVCCKLQMIIYVWKGEISGHIHQFSRSKEFFERTTCQNFKREVLLFASNSGRIPEFPARNSSVRLILSSTDQESSHQLRTWFSEHFCAAKLVV